MTTLTNRIAAIQVKMLHLQFRMKKIYEDQKRLTDKLPKYKTPQEIIKGMNNAVYNTIDMIVTFEHMFQLSNDIFSTPELKEKFTEEITRIIGTVRSVAHRWKPVRNKLGGHIDLQVIEGFCRENKYVGVFLSEDIECDLGMLNMLLLESAVNSVNDQTKLFEEKIDIKRNDPGPEMKRFVETLNRDWNKVFSYFEPLMRFMYTVGKEEKMRCTPPDEWKGLIYTL